MADNHDQARARTAAGSARGFVNAMNDYFIEANPIKRDAIAAHQLDVLRQYQRPREKKLRLSDIKEMFAKMRQPKRQ